MSSYTNNTTQAGPSDTEEESGAPNTGTEQFTTEDPMPTGPNLFAYNLAQDALGRQDAGVLLVGNCDVQRGQGTSLRSVLVTLAYDAQRELDQHGFIHRRRRAMLREIIRINNTYTDGQLVTFVQTLRQVRAVAEGRRSSGNE
jgi:hypothetical protein